MDNQDFLSGKVAVVQTNENTGRIEHFQTIGKNEDGSYNISYWVSSNSGWGAYHIGSYDAGRAISALLNYQQVHHSDEVSRLGRNPLLPDNDPPKNETVVKEHRQRALEKKPEKQAQKDQEEQKEKKPEERIEAIEPETEGDQPSVNMGPGDDQQEKRGNAEAPALESDDSDEPEEYTGGTLVEDIEHWIPSLFADAHKGVASLKSELESDVDEDNWIGKAIGASALDTLDFAMSFTEGIPLGLLDTRHIGEGFAEGTWEGAKKDITRALNVIPEGRVVKVIDRALMASNMIEALGTGDYKSAALTAATAAGAMAGKSALVKFRKSKVPIHIKALSKEKALKEIAGHYSETFKKTNIPNAKVKGIVAGKRTQKILKKKYGTAAVDEPSLGITSGQYHEGPRGDMYVYTGKDDKNLFVEFKSNAKIENGKMMVKDIFGNWVEHSDKQFSQSFGYKHVAKNISNASSHVVNSSGEIFSFEPKIGKWVHGIR